MSERPGVLCAGRLYCDLVFGDLPGMPVLGEEVFAGSLTIAAGGGAYITAAYLSALGRPAGLASVFPAAPFDAVLLPELTAAGLDLAACVPAETGADPQITAAMITGGDRAFLTRRTGAAVPAGLIAQLGEGGYGHLHIGELATLADHPGLIAAARGAGMTISLDCSWDAQVLARPEAAALVAGVDVFLPNRAEAALLSSHGALAQFAPLVVIKHGAEGAECIAESGRHSIAAHPARVVDTTGAGDAFNAGFLDAWLDGLAPLACLEAGAAAAAVAVARFGGARGLTSLQALRAARPAAE
ncbi:MAG: carbohydrate kinase family protein [Paracoccaceae bacterium]